MDESDAVLIGDDYINYEEDLDDAVDDDDNMTLMMIDNNFHLDMSGRAIGALGVEHCINGGW